ncbi:MAG: hypothetical protein QOG87_1592 [Actinomycetota bacterium]
MVREARRLVFARRATKRMRRDQRGVALVEFALMLPFLALLVFGTVDMGRAYSLQNRLRNASREGAAYAQVEPTRVSGCVNGGDGTITKRAGDEDADLVGESGYAVVVLDAAGNPITGCASSVSTGAKVRVRVQATFDVLTPFVGGFTGDPILLKATTEVIAQ